jgi:hypothetical protein
MGAVVAKDIVNMFKLQTNELYVDAPKLTNSLNSKILNANLISPEVFENKSLTDAIKILSKIFDLSIETRMRMLGDNAKNISRTMMIQNLDFQ